MARPARAGKVLAEQVQTLKPRATFTFVGEPDGFGVVRTIRFNKATGKWLEPLLAEMQDRRIATVEETDQGLEVTFVANSRADSRDAFPLEAAATVVASE